jgi:hypothetical protein
VTVERQHRVLAKSVTVTAALGFRPGAPEGSRAPVREIKVKIKPRRDPGDA